MRAAVLWKTGKTLSIEDNIQVPPLKPGQILIKLLYSGVCRSQLMEVMGNRGTDKFLPHLLGHEGSGKVVAISKGVSKVARGDWVILGWIKAKGKNVAYYTIPVDFEIRGNFLGYIKFKRALSKSKKMLKYGN